MDSLNNTLRTSGSYVTPQAASGDSFSIKNQPESTTKKADNCNPCNMRQGSTVQGSATRIGTPGKGADVPEAFSRSIPAQVKKIIADIKSGVSIFFRTTARRAKGEEKTSLGKAWSQPENLGYRAGSNLGQKLNNIASNIQSAASFVGGAQKQELTTKDTFVKNAKVYDDTEKELEAAYSKTMENESAVVKDDLKKQISQIENRLATNNYGKIKLEIRGMLGVDPPAKQNIEELAKKLGSIKDQAERLRSDNQSESKHQCRVLTKTAILIESDINKLTYQSLKTNHPQIKGLEEEFLKRSTNIDNNRKLGGVERLEHHTAIINTTITILKSIESNESEVGDKAAIKQRIKQLEAQVERLSVGP